MLMPSMVPTPPPPATRQKVDGFGCVSARVAIVLIAGILTEVAIAKYPA